MRQSRHRVLHTMASLGGLLIGLFAAALLPSSARGQEDRHHDITVVARKYAFEPASIEVDQNDLVKVTFRTEDIPHSFTLDAYRIAKRVAAGQTTTFEFRADTPGTFTFYCNLKTDDGCRDMKGTLVVRPR